MLLQRDEHPQVQRGFQELVQRGCQAGGNDPNVMQCLIHVRGRKRAESFYAMPVGMTAGPGDAGQLREPRIDLKIKGPARNHDAHRQGPRFTQHLRNRIQPGRIPARPGAERIHLIQNQQRGPTRRHSGQHSRRRPRQAQRGAETRRVPELTEPVQPRSQHHGPFRDGSPVRE